MRVGLEVWLLSQKTLCIDGFKVTVRSPIRSTCESLARHRLGFGVWGFGSGVGPGEILKIHIILNFVKCLPPFIVSFISKV